MGRWMSMGLGLAVGVGGAGAVNAAADCALVGDREVAELQIATVTLAGQPQDLTAYDGFTVELVAQGAYDIDLVVTDAAGEPVTTEQWE